MPRPQSVTVSGGTGSSAVLPVNWRANNFGIGFGAVVTGTLTYSVQHTFQNVLAGETPVWFDHDVVFSKTTTEDGNYAYPVMAVRLNVTAWTSGGVTLTLVEGD